MGVDAARLADELRAEQDHASNQEKAKRTLETQINELENRLAEANEMAMGGGRAAMAKLESRIREMEIELGGVQSRTSESSKAYQKSERRIKELQFQQEEDKITRTRCPTLLKSCSRRSRRTRSRSRRQRKSPPSTWLSSGRPSRSSRRPRTSTRWPRLSCLLSGLDLSSNLARNLRCLDSMLPTESQQHL